MVRVSCVLHTEALIYQCSVKQKNGRIAHGKNTTSVCIFQSERGHSSQNTDARAQFSRRMRARLFIYCFYTQGRKQFIWRQVQPAKDSALGRLVSLDQTPPSVTEVRAAALPQAPLIQTGCSPGAVLMEQCTYIVRGATKRTERMPQQKKLCRVCFGLESCFIIIIHIKNN